MKIIVTPGAPKGQGSYSHAVHSGGFLFLSGQLPVHPETMQVENGKIRAQTRRALENIAIVLNGGGLGFSDVVKVNVYLAEMALFGEMNIVYEEVFQSHKPARTTIGVKGLQLDVLVEIDCIAEYNERKKLNT